MVLNRRCWERASNTTPNRTAVSKRCTELLPANARPAMVAWMVRCVVSTNRIELSLPATKRREPSAETHSPTITLQTRGMNEGRAEDGDHVTTVPSSPPENSRPDIENTRFRIGCACQCKVTPIACASALPLRSYRR